MQASKVKNLLFISLGIMLLGISCGSKDKNSELPAYVIDRETFTALLTDVHLIEASLIKKQSAGLLSFDMAEIYYDSLFKKYAVTSSMLDSSLLYYSRRPEIFDVIYMNVITNLSKKESEQQIQEKEEALDDAPEPVIETPDQVEEPDEEEFIPPWYRVSENPWVQQGSEPL